MRNAVLADESLAAAVVVVLVVVVVVRCLVLGYSVRECERAKEKEGERGRY